MLEFDKYASYIFSSYLITTIVFIILIITAVSFKKQTLKKLKIKFAREK